MDPKGQELANRYGIELKDAQILRGPGVGMDMAPKPKTQDLWREKIPEVRIDDLPRYQPSEDQLVPSSFETVTVHAETPPQVFQEVQEFEAPISEVRYEEISKPSVVRTAPRASESNLAPKSGHLGKLAFFSIVGAIILALALTVFILPEARVIVFARSIPVKSSLQVNIDQNAKDLDSSKNLLPGKIVIKDIVFSQHFEATGKVDVSNKASGKIQIYNFSGRTLRLNAATTVITIGEKKYRFDSDVTNIVPSRYLPGTRNIDPASLTSPVTIIAVEGGVDSQAAAGIRAEILNQAFGNKPTQLYSETVDQITGGDSRFSSVITPSDIENASRQLIAAIKEEAKRQSQQKDNLLLEDSGIRIDSQQVVFDKQAGDASVNFDGEVRARITALGYDRNALLTLVKQKISATLPKNEYLAENGPMDLVSSYTNLDFDSGSGLLNITVNTAAGAKLDTRGIATKITGKNSEQIKELLLSDPDIDGVDIEFRPFWVKTVPKFSGRVTVTEELHQ
jgi:hypothetical protein